MADVNATLDLDARAAFAAVDQIERRLNAVGNLSVDLDAGSAARDLDRIADEADEVEDSLRGAETRAEGLGSAIKGALAFIGAREALQGIVSLVNAASDLEESTSKASVVFEDSFGTIEEFARNSAEAVGLSEAAALEATGTFGNLFRAQGLASDTAADLSTGVVSLAADLASFNNIEVAEAVEKLRAGLIGEVEPVRTLGINFDAASVEAKAFELGLADANGEVDNGAKLQARYAIFLEQTTTAQGDFARTSDGMANASRIAQAEFANLQAEIGQELLPVALELVAVARNDLIPALRDSGPALASIVSSGGRTVLALLTAILPIVEALAPAIEVFADGLAAMPPELVAVAGGLLAINRALGGSGLLGNLSLAEIRAGGLATKFGQLSRAGQAGVVGAGMFVAVNVATQEFIGLAEDGAAAADEFLDSLGRLSTIGSDAGAGQDLLASNAGTVLAQVDDLVAAYEALEGRNRVGPLVNPITALLDLPELARRTAEINRLREEVDELTQSQYDLDFAFAIAGGILDLDPSDIDPIARALATLGISVEDLLAQDRSDLPAFLIETINAAGGADAVLGDTADAFGDVAGEAGDAAAEVRDFLDVLDELVGRPLQLDEQIAGFQQSLDDLVESAKDAREDGFGPMTDVLDATDAAAREVASAFRDGVGDLLAVARAADEAGASEEELARIIREGIDDLRASAREADLTEDQIRALIEAYNLTPEQISTEIALYGDLDVIARIERLLGYTARLDRQYGIVVSPSASTGPGGIIEDAAEGAYVHATPGGRLLRVAEGGADEVVIPANRPDRAVALLDRAGLLDVPVPTDVTPGASMDGVGPLRQYGPIYVTPRDFREFVREMDDHDRRARLMGRAGATAT